jgi:outer membrane protein assembly factor BamD (BamD/ComL family)
MLVRARFRLKQILVVTLVLCFGACVYASVAGASAWEELGKKTLYFLGSGRCPIPVWLQRYPQMKTAFEEPDSSEAGLLVKAFLEQALAGYEQESPALQGRIALQRNPACILGLFLVDKFKGTKLSEEGKLQFNNCVEQACSAGSGMNLQWKEQLEKALELADENCVGSFETASFEEAETPFLLIYLSEQGSSEQVRRKSRKVLSRYLLERCGVEAAVAQYHVLLPDNDFADIEEKEQYGAKALLKFEGPEQSSGTYPRPPRQLDRVNESLFDLACELRRTEGSGIEIGRYAEKIYTTVVTPGPFAVDCGPGKHDSVRLFWQIERQRVGRLLCAEYDVAKRKILQAGGLRSNVELEPVIFTALLLQKDSFEEIHSGLSKLTPEADAKGRLYRFAKFAQRLKQSYMARCALDAAVKQIDDIEADVELLVSIAQMQAETKNYQKAIEIYEKIEQNCRNPDTAQEAVLNIIRIYGQSLKLYDKAREECKRFLEKFPDSRRRCEVEFLAGKFAYLAEDYAESNGRLDAFEKKYPDNPYIPQAMMFAALSRMSEGKSEEAIYRFRELIRMYPKGESAAQSKLLIGYTQISRQEYGDAVETLRQLLEQFPQSKYTEQAQRLMERLNRVQWR